VDSGYSLVYTDPVQYKSKQSDLVLDLLLKLICEGETEAVRKLLREAPNANAFLSSKEFNFHMFTHSVEKNKETKLLSPLCVALNVGDFELVAVLINCKVYDNDNRPKRR